VVNGAADVGPDRRGLANLVLGRFALDRIVLAPAPIHHSEEAQVGIQEQDPPGRRT
jgi:hypothetical protein